MPLCDSGAGEGLLTLGAEAAGDAVVLAQLGALRVGAGVSQGGPHSRYCVQGHAWAAGGHTLGHAACPGSWGQQARPQAASWALHG